jgi:acyl-CoA synthetase (AMP-forming)/AMP-acid ligase II
LLQTRHETPTLRDRLAHWARTRRDAPFVIEADTGATLTYREFVDGVEALQRALGRAPQRVALMAPGSVASAIVWIGALTGGHTLLPLAPDAPALEIERVSQRFLPDLLITAREGADMGFKLAPERVWNLERVRALAEDGSRGADTHAPQSGSLLLFTSGSTGEPKAVMLDASKIARTAERIRLSHQLTSDDRGLTTLPFFHINAPVVSLCASLMAGASTVIAPRFSLSHFWEWIERYEVTWASLVPTIVALLLKTEPPAFLPGALRFMRTASAPLPAEHMTRFERRFGIPLIETYGLTEAASQVCANPLPPATHKAGSVGLPVGITLRICVPASADAHEALRDVARGATGEVCVKGPSLIPGYAGGVDASAFQDGWFRTGDLGYQDADGYLYLTGRLRDVIIRGGENVAPREVEEALLNCPDVNEVAVIGCPDPLYGEQIVAYVAPATSWTPALEAALRVVSATRLSAHKRPAEYVPLSGLPRTTTGKVDRPKLRWMWERRTGYLPAAEKTETPRAG